MREYIIGCNEFNITLYADKWEIGAYGLSFFIDDEYVGCFNTWDYWISKEIDSKDEDET